MFNCYSGRGTVSQIISKIPQFKIIKIGPKFVFFEISCSIAILIVEQFLKWVPQEFQGDQLLSLAAFPASNILNFVKIL